MSSVLFVCTANVCRSPMASTLFKDIVSRELSDQGGWLIESAGTLAVEGMPAAKNSRLVMNERGFDIEDHRSQTVDRDLLNKFDLILTMERHHKESLSIEFPEISGRVYVISEMVGHAYDIWDPVGGTLNEFRATADELADILTQGYGRIKRLAVEGSDNKV
jgi:protein-tyrosine phosphatase